MGLEGTMTVYQWIYCRCYGDCCKEGRIVRVMSSMPRKKAMDTADERADLKNGSEDTVGGRPRKINGSDNASNE